MVKFRIGRIVYLSLSRDGSTMGFAFPKELRNALVEGEPEKFSLPSQGDMRYHWVHVQLAALDEEELRELVETRGRSASRSASRRSTPRRAATLASRAVSSAGRAPSARGKPGFPREPPR